MHSYYNVYWKKQPITPDETNLHLCIYMCVCVCVCIRHNMLRNLLNILY